MRNLALLLPFVLLGCGGGGEDDAETAAEPAVPALAVPRTVDRGDGLTVEITADGTGEVAHVGDLVLLNCDTRIKDAEAKIASTEGWDAPMELRLGDPSVLAGLSRGIDGLSVGSKARIEVPPALAYGPDGNAPAGVAADATLVFDVEILGIRP